MKTIIVTLTGQCEVFMLAQPKTELTPEQVEKYDYIADMEQDGLVDGWMYELSFMKTIDSLTYQDGDDYDDDEDADYDEDAVFGSPSENEIPIIEKGKYRQLSEYFAEFVKIPFVVQHIDSTYVEYEYLIELDDDEEFDPMKLQLLRSDREVEFLPYGIITSNIMYNGKILPTISEPCFDTYNDSGCFLYSGEGSTMKFW